MRFRECPYRMRLEPIPTRITKTEWEKLGGCENSNLFRKQSVRAWSYWRTK